MSVLPSVSPANNADGIALSPVITATYPFSLDQGSVNTVNCFLVKKISSLGSNRTEPVSIKVESKRLELLTTDTFAGADYGDDLDAGNKYRTQIQITPTAHLDQHTEYSVILSKDLCKTSLFDIKKNIDNIGTKAPILKGPYSGLINNTYSIEVLIGGNENTASYKVVRLSDSLEITGFIASKRFIEIEKNLFIKFEVGTYVAGDHYTVVVKPAVKTNEIYSWDFKTGDSDYVVPSDENSGVIIGLPVEDVVIGNSEAPFKLSSIVPGLNSVMNDPINRTVVFTFNKNIKPDSITADTIKVIAESTVTNYYGTLDFEHTITDNKLIITFLEAEE